MLRRDRGCMSWDELHLRYLGCEALFGSFAVGVWLLLAAACQARQPQPEYQTTATIKDIMDSMVDPNADYLWESVATIVTAAGTEERAPRTDEEWTNLRKH